MSSVSICKTACFAIVLQCPIRDFTLPLRSLMNWFPTEEAKLMRESLTALIEELQEQIEEAIRQDNDALTLVENEKG